MELQIKNIMQQQGRTNQWLADQLGTSAQYAGQVAKGSNGATLAQYERIADALGVKLWQLFAPTEDYVLREEHDRQMQEAMKERELRERPDLIVVDRKTGKTQGYVMVEQQEGE